MKKVFTIIGYVLLLAFCVVVAAYEIVRGGHDAIICMSSVFAGFTVRTIVDTIVS